MFSKLTECISPLICSTGIARQLASCSSSTPVARRSLKQTQNASPQHHDTDDRRNARRQQNRASRHVLGLLGDWIEVRGGDVRKKLERSVEGLRRPHGCDGQHDPTPLAHGQSNRYAHGNHSNRGHRMKPRVVLGPEYDRDAPHSALDTAQLPAEAPLSCRLVGSHELPAHLRVAMMLKQSLEKHPRLSQMVAFLPFKGCPLEV